jgi:LacI family fructose operon transcriptional repressor
MTRARSRKTTIYDIAVAADVSPTTVSLVLNDAWRALRIKQDTATRIIEVAQSLGYAVNLKARGLRLSRSGLAGMIIPHYRNRFFAGLAEAFEAEARKRGLCPVVVSTHRNPDNELTVTQTLLAQQVEFLFFAGVRDPDPLNELCWAAHVRCVNIDLPGTKAPSAVSDNRNGARQLTEVILQKLRARKADTSDIFFFGGVPDDDATGGRVNGFKDALSANGITLPAGAFDLCGYAPAAAARSLASRYDELGRLPSGLFVNGVTALEGALRFTSTLPVREFSSTVVGSFDWDPFAAYLPFDLTMVRQNVELMIATGFELIDDPGPDRNRLVVVPTSFGRTGELDGSIEDWSEREHQTYAD